MVKGFSPLVLLGVVVVIVIGGVLVVSQSDLDLQLGPCTPPSCFGGGITPAGKAGNVSRVDPIPDDDNQVKVKFPLFTTSEKLYLNDTINKVVQQLGAQQLPTVLKSGTFKGNVNSAYTQTIHIGAQDSIYPRIVLAKEPNSTNDPSDGFIMSTSAYGNNRTYALEVVFAEDINFTSPSSKNKLITLFGRTFKIEPSTTKNKLVLVNPANSNDRLSLINGQPVKKGIDENVIDGTLVKLPFPTDFGSVSFMDIYVAAQSLDNDFVYKTTLFKGLPLIEHHYVDPIFGTFKLTFGGMKNSFLYFDSLDERDIGKTNDFVSFGPSGTNNQGLSDQIQIDDFRDWRNITHDVNWYDNSTGHAARLGYDDNNQDKEQIRVVEMTDLKKGNQVIVGRVDGGLLLQLETVVNSTSGNGYSDDEVVFKDVLDPSLTYHATITSDGKGKIMLDGQLYDLAYSGISGDSDNMIVRLNDPASQNLGFGLFFPTIKTLMGAKLMFYQPTPINLNTIPTFYGGVQGGQFFLMLPDGQNYSTVLFSPRGNGLYNVTKTGIFSGSFRGVLNTLNVSSVVNFSIGELEYEVRGTGIQNRTTLYLHDEEHQRVQNPAAVLFEEAQDDGRYQALIVKIKGSAINSNPLSVDDIETTWGEDNVFDNLFMPVSGTNDAIFLSQDRYGAVVGLSDENYPSNNYIGAIIYPDKQSEALVYIQEI
jgi:hypothetical protein